MDRTTCERELRRRQIPFAPLADVRGVIAPLRLRGPIHGISFRSQLPPRARESSPYEIFDCRLVLALDDFARVLERHGIVEVIHYSAYRPPSPKAPLAGPGGQGRRHAGALALDAALFKRADGRTLSVEKDFGGRIGRRPCTDLSAGSELEHIACESANLGLFNVVLTPDYNWDHRNHFHLEVTPGVRWLFVR